ncbi:MAG: hypothetical protein R3Y64_04365 [Peptostreptococcaceae bacterium]
MFEKSTIKGVPKSEENLTKVNDGYYVYGQNIQRQYSNPVLMDKKYLQKIKTNEPILAYTSSVGEIGMISESFYRTGNNGAFQGLFSKMTSNSLSIMKFILTSTKLHFKDLGYGTSMSNIMNMVIKLPLKNGEIDFEFIENFMVELEKQKIDRLKSYLESVGLSNVNSK